MHLKLIVHEDRCSFWFSDGREVTKIKNVLLPSLNISRTSFRKTHKKRKYKKIDEMILFFYLRGVWNACDILFCQLDCYHDYVNRDERYQNYKDWKLRDFLDYYSEAIDFTILDGFLFELKRLLRFYDVMVLLKKSYLEWPALDGLLWTTFLYKFWKDKELVRLSPMSYSICNNSYKFILTQIFKDQRGKGNMYASEEEEEFLSQLQLFRSYVVLDQIGACSFLPENKRVFKATLLFSLFCILDQIGGIRVVGKMNKNCMLGFKMKLALLKYIVLFPGNEVDLDGAIVGRFFKDYFPEVEYKILNKSFLVKRSIFVHVRSSLCRIWGEDLTEALFEDFWTSIHRERVSILDYLVLMAGISSHYCEFIYLLGLDKQEPFLISFLGSQCLKDLWKARKIEFSYDFLLCYMEESFYEVLKLVNGTAKFSLQVLLHAMPKILCSLDQNTIFESIRKQYEVAKDPEYLKVNCSAMKKDLHRCLEEARRIMQNTSIQNVAIELSKNLEDSLDKDCIQDGIYLIHNHIRKFFYQMSGNSYVKMSVLYRLRLWFEQGYLCTYCGNSLDFEEVVAGSLAQVDHIIPLSCIPDNSLQNKLIVCKSCNESKRDRLPREWILAERRDYDLYERRVGNIFCLHRALLPYVRAKQKRLLLSSSRNYESLYGEIFMKELDDKRKYFVKQFTRLLNQNHLSGKGDG